MTNAEIAQQIVEALFTNGFGEKADRLQLVAKVTGEGAPAMLGGWGRTAVAGIVQEALDRAFGPGAIVAVPRDTTRADLVARVAGDVFTRAHVWYVNHDGDGLNGHPARAQPAAVVWSVAIARAILAEVDRTERGATP